MSTDLIEMDLRQALDAASDEIARLRDECDHVRSQFLDCSGHNARLRAALMEICTMQGEPIQIARKALAKAEEKK